MPRFRASIMDDDTPFVRVVDARGRVLEEAIAVDTDAGLLWRFRLDEGGKLPEPEPDGRMPREVVRGKWRLQFRERDGLPDSEATWRPWTEGSRPPYRFDVNPETDL